MILTVFGLHPNIINFLACCTLKYAIYFSHQLPWNSREKKIFAKKQDEEFRRNKKKISLIFLFLSFLFLLWKVKKENCPSGKSNKCEISKKKSISRLYVLHQHFHNVCKLKKEYLYLRFLLCVPRILILKEKIYRSNLME